MGTWEGKYLDNTNDLGQPRLVVEIFSFNDSLFTGLSHLYYKGNKYEHYKIVGRYFKKESLFVFREVSTIAVDLGDYGNCLGLYMMKFSRKDNTDMLDGIWTANRKDCTLDSRVWLQKNRAEIKNVPPVVKKIPPIKTPAVKNKTIPVADPQKKLPAKVLTVPDVPVRKDIPVVKNLPVTIPAVITQRGTDVQSLLEIADKDKDSIKVEVYDNGEIDGDSVSVYEDHIQRIYKKRISTKPLTFYVSLNKNLNPLVHLRLVAESLGSIPPCTALMIVTTKSKRYEVHLSSNFSKNATVELFLKE